MTAKQTPLLDLLRSVPADARMSYEHSPTEHSMIPVGRLAADAADALEAQHAEIERLRAFALEVLAVWPEGGLDGDDLQEIAVAHGLLMPETKHAPCSEEGCNCAEYYAPDEWAEGITCYRRAEWLTARAALEKP